MLENHSTTTEHYKELINALGRNHVKGKIETPLDFIRIAAGGLNPSIIKNFQKYFNLSREAVADVLAVSAPTIYRWVRTNKPLERNKSIRLLYLADLFLYGIEVFESRENFFKWLQLPNEALGGLEPWKLLEIPEGISQVRDILGRIEYGVYS